ncbi:DUF2252 domain-containing protein [Methylosinus sp. Ce-a6]|uniref:DUF2252 domain-containing protein n=1 Tax=Methylosinus sp. Ce-a6 TaxID=2172005 RepID=UPI00135696B3|nr:DUF2252 domain-containing protein [Methylosinus sp. Ce-a6]
MQDHRPSHHLVFAERYAAGKERRRFVPRESLADFSPTERDPTAILAATDEGRVASLLPIRYERMAHSSFAFLRGAAAIMAEDLAALPAPGLAAQSCGDCHLMNFGALLSSEGNVLFDINDFDETLPNIDFTVDLRRLCASFAVAALDAGRSDKRARHAAELAARAYRRHMLSLSRLSPLQAWRDRIDLAHVADGLHERLARKLRTLVAATRPDREDDNFPHLESTPLGLHIEERPPLIYHLADGDGIRFDIAGLFASCGATLNPEVVALLRRYELEDTAFKVVGVGSVGTYCAIGLFATADDEPLFLQIKEARPSVLAALSPEAATQWREAQGKRVVHGQRVMQASTDLFLGWTKDEATGRHFYVRHLKNRRLDSVAELFEEHALDDYASLCGRVLARAHARSADPAVICGYMGKSDVFDDAMASFAMLYAARNTCDHAEFLAWRAEASNQSRRSAETR